ncbi:MAG: hypothetical protein JRG90_22050 [Deltaproteobacteria bacterium]|nr:hypothetical protein [Deltaproteobacteria bacterium]
MGKQNLRSISKRPRRSALLALLVAVAVAGVGCAGAKVSLTPVQLSLWPGAQVFTQDTPVRGMALNLLGGAQDDVAGLDVGLLNTVEKEFTGIGAGAVNLGHGHVRGIQVGLGNTADTSLAGMQAGIANQVDGEMKGAQLGMGNFAGKCALFNLNPKGFLPFFPFFLIGF